MKIRLISCNFSNKTSYAKFQGTNSDNYPRALPKVLSVFSKKDDYLVRFNNFYLNHLYIYAITHVKVKSKR